MDVHKLMLFASMFIDITCSNLEKIILILFALVPKIVPDIWPIYDCFDLRISELRSEGYLGAFQRSSAGFK